MFRNAAAILTGIFTAVAVYMLIKEIGDIVYSPPPGLSFSDTESVRRYHTQLPFGAFLIIFAKPVAAAFFGTLVGCYVGTANATLFGAVTGGIVLAHTISRFIAIPHPLWLSLATLIGIVLTTLLAIRVAPPSDAAPPDLFDNDGDTG